MAISANNPRLSNQIKSDVPEIQQKEAALLKMDPTNVADLEVGAKRLTEISSGNWQFQMWNGSQWVNVGKLKMDVDTVDGYDASITPKANTVAVRGSDGKLKDSITGNAATADSATTLSETLVVGKGGTGATTAAQARSNLGVPPTSHASANTTYGISSESVYGHAKASSDAPVQDTDAGAVGIKVSEFARGDHSHKKVLGNASTYGQVKLTDSVSDGSDASSSVAASAKAVKTAYDKATSAATTVMVGATASSAGKAGLVPAPGIAQRNLPLRGDGQWAEYFSCFVKGLYNSDTDKMTYGELVEKLNSLLPKSGGIITGQLIKNGYLAAAETSDSVLAIQGGTGATDGAVLELYGANNSTLPGGFQLRARNGNTYSSLLGTTDGRLQWAGKNIPSIVSTWRRGMLLSRKWNDGLIENFGYVETDKSVSYHFPFSDNNYTLLLGFNVKSANTPKYSQIGAYERTETYITGSVGAGVNLFFYAVGY